MLVRYVFLVFGEDYGAYWQTQYAMLSLIGRAPSPWEVSVVTDHPERFRWLKDVVMVDHVDTATIANWRGRHDYIWRIKIQAMRRNPPTGRAMVYLDGDMVVLDDLTPMVEAMATGGVFMHTREHVLWGTRSRTKRRLAAAVIGSTWGELVATRESAMWNAGVVAIGPGQEHILERVLVASDAMSDASGNHILCEQFAFSLSLAATGRLAEARTWIDHYWGNKPGYQAEIVRCFARFHIDGTSVADAVSQIRAAPLRLPLEVRESRWRRWLGRRLAAKPVARSSP